MTTTISKWTTARGAQIEMHTRHVTERFWFRDDFGKEHFKKVDEIEIDKVIANGEVYTNSLFGRTTHEGARFIDLGFKTINGKRTKMMIPLPADIEASVWGEWDARQKEERERQAARDKAEQEELAKKIANGYCTKCGSYCWGDCEAN